jgi:hypothetical protein
VAGELQPLDQQFAIVDAQGRPTQYFTRWAQQRQIDITEAITLDQLGDYLAAHLLHAGNGIGLTPDGNLASGPTITAKVQEILDQISTTRGVVLYRGAAAWAALAPGAAGLFLQTAGAGADPLWAAAGGGGGGKTILGSTEGIITTGLAPPAGNYLMKLIIADADFTINKVCFTCGAAVATAKYQPFVYACNFGVSTAGALLGSGPQVTGSVAGRNEVPLTTPVVITKGTFIWLGVNVITTALSIHGQPGGVFAFAANGGSSVPSNPGPVITTSNAANGIYAFFGI